MDYRHTEDFARRMEAAELRAHALREEALNAFFTAVGRGLHRAWHALAVRLARPGRSENFLPEA